MALEKNGEHGTLLHRVKRACSISYVTLRVLLIVIIAAWSLVALFALLSLMSPPAFGWIDVLGMPVLLNFLIVGLLAAVFIGMTMLILRDISKGETPLSRKQGRRIRLLAYLMLARVLFDLLLSLVTIALRSSGLAFLSYPVSLSVEPSLYMNLEALIFAIVLYCISLVFEYGVLLQRDSDDIL